MWKLWHRLFGWDYVQVDMAGLVVKRLRWTPNGNPYIKWLGRIYLLRGKIHGKKYGGREWFDHLTIKED